ncbi:hypothetical protein BDA99DRAFT_536287 [Phascolomyces articulosus]|uniref:Uncharacterized protein n=1 Tax=Phascolomyces articulosus TaxID=60185 RepID=A0AAD5KD80_9FUNG|nr:hypothetical protein BDA99DRAFT_536287 [Phascolomyces articulosus]
MDDDKGDIAITIIALVIGLTAVTMLIVCFHIKKARENNASNERPRTTAERYQERHRQILLQERMERELSMNQNPTSQVDPPSYNVAIDIIDPRMPPPSYHDHRRDTQITQQQHQRQYQQ